MNNIILLSVDTLRYDVISKYLTPNIHQLLNESIYFTNCYAQSPCTMPSFASALTGYYPHEHGVSQKRKNSLPPDIPYLPQVMKRRGYKTICLQGNSQLDKTFKFNRGFDIYLDKEICRRHKGKIIFPTADTISLHFLQLIQKVKDNYFMWINFIDPHCPYDTPVLYQYLPVELLPYLNKLQNGLKSRKEFYNLKQNKEIELTPVERKYVFSRYLAGVRKADQGIGEILHTLKVMNLLDKTIVVFFSDHGEEFWDHGQNRNTEDPYYRGVDHGHTLYNELIKVPLAYRLPSGNSRNVDDLSKLKNIFKVLTLEKINSQEVIDHTITQEAYSEYLLYGSEKKCYVDSEFNKIVFAPQKYDFEYYNLRLDPSEQNNLSPDKILKQKILQFTNTNEIQRKENIQIPNQVKDRLVQLGYL